MPLDEKTHNIAIELCKECGDTRKAVDILRKMEAEGVSEPLGFMLELHVFAESLFCVSVGGGFCRDWARLGE